MYEIYRNMDVDKLFYLYPSEMKPVKANSLMNKDSSGLFFCQPLNNTAQRHLSGGEPVHLAERR